jgi:hypothetical protein
MSGKNHLFPMFVGAEMIASGYQAKPLRAPVSDVPVTVERMSRPGTHSPQAPQLASQQGGDLRKGDWERLFRI